MSSNSRPPIFRRAFVIILSITLVVGYVVYEQMRKSRRGGRSSKSTTVIEDTRLIDGAIDQWAMEQAEKQKHATPAAPASEYPKEPAPQ